jgi:hypothetical protein
LMGIMAGCSSAHMRCSGATGMSFLRHR